MINGLIRAIIMIVSNDENRSLGGCSFIESSHHRFHAFICNYFLLSHESMSFDQFNPLHFSATPHVNILYEFPVEPGLKLLRKIYLSRVEFKQIPRFIKFTQKVLKAKYMKKSLTPVFPYSGTSHISPPVPDWYMDSCRTILFNLLKQQTRQLIKVCVCVCPSSQKRSRK